VVTNKPALVLLAACVLSPAILVLLLPQLQIIAPTLLVAGFGALILCFLFFSFRRSKAGPFAQWIQPAKFFGMTFTKQELLTLRLSACVGLGGALAVAALLVSG